MMATSRVELIALAGLPLVRPGDDLPALISRGLERAHLTLRAFDVLVIAQKIVSKAESRFADLASVVPSAEAERVAEKVGKDPRLVELILAESTRIVRQHPGVLIVEHRSGFIMANAGIDRSNVGEAGGGEQVLLLPRDPDTSAQRIQAALASQAGGELGVIISDSFGRPWREGVIGVAIGAAGLPALIDSRGEDDLFGRPLQATTRGFADEIASAASLLMGQGAEAQPVVLARGLIWPRQKATARALIRPADHDLFR